MTNFYINYKLILFRAHTSEDRHLLHDLLREQNLNLCLDIHRPFQLIAVGCNTAVHCVCLSEVLRTLFDVFYDEEIISEETFRRWQGSSDPAEQAGKGVAVRSVQQFFTWLDASSTS